MKKMLLLLFIPIMLFSFAPKVAAKEKASMLFHLKTGLKHNDAQICVAYNMIWAALEEGASVKVLVDADAINTFKIGWLGKDAIQKYKLPENLRQGLATQFEVPFEETPVTYGDFLNMLHDKGAEFYINSAMLVVAGVEDQLGTVENVSAKFFKPVTLREMIRFRMNSDFYMVY
ncbi:hypothetical protein MNBD_NITROSPIRAE01-437 [hydrothermal vent metagenome]|uniref:Uncharacterized protein n=1 Tax=hydrothermal vent metagenome TaxID=652676 RepID=A0A3B1DHS5_9ZZZZ